MITGARDEDSAKIAAKKFAQIIKKLDYPVKFLDFKLQNMVGSIDVKFPVRLEGLAYEHDDFANVSWDCSSILIKCSMNLNCSPA